MTDTLQIHYSNGYEDGYFQAKKEIQNLVKEEIYRYKSLKVSSQSELLENIQKIVNAE